MSNISLFLIFLSPKFITYIIHDHYYIRSITLFYFFRAFVKEGMLTFVKSYAISRDMDAGAKYVKYASGL